MTQLVITPKVSDKTARFSGTIAAGEHVAVTIKGGAGWLGEDDGANLTLLVIDRTTHKVAAVFPRPAEMLAEGETADAWDSTQGDLTCTLDLNTLQMVNAARHMLCVPVLFVLGDKDNPRTLYFRDEYRVEFWPERLGDVPYDLDKWPGQIDEWEEIVANFGATLSSHVADTVKHVTAAERATWQAKYAKPGTGIPKGDLASDVQTSLGKADTALQEHQSLSAYVNAAAYDSGAKKILLKNGSTTVAEINAADFVKDGMVSSVTVSNGNLVITFNTDAGKEPISVPLSDIGAQQIQSDWSQSDPTKKDFIKNKPPIPDAVTVVQPSTSATTGQAADAKVTGDMLYTGFTPWKADSPLSGYDLESCVWKSSMSKWEVSWKAVAPGGTDRTTLADGAEDDVSITGSSPLAYALSRHRITPTKTSQLTNDGDGASPFAKVSQLSELATKAELPYPFVAATLSNGILTVQPRTVATYTADSSAAAFTVAVGTGVSGVARDCVLVVDCTATGAVAPTVTWPSNFHPRTDAEEIAPVAGVRNVFYISEYAATATGEFIVGGWHEEVA